MVAYILFGTLADMKNVKCDNTFSKSMKDGS